MSNHAWPPSRNRFELVTTNRTWVFAVDVFEEKNQWMTILTDALNLKGQGRRLRNLSTAGMALSSVALTVTGSEYNHEPRGGGVPARSRDHVTHLALLVECGERRVLALPLHALASAVLNKEEREQQPEQRDGGTDEERLRETHQVNEPLEGRRPEGGARLATCSGEAIESGAHARRESLSREDEGGRVGPEGRGGRERVSE